MNGNILKLTPKGNSNIDIALSLAEAGLRIFPAGQNKRPLVADWGNRATVSSEKIRQWWGEWPHAIPALPTGKLNGLTVIDLDIGHGDGRNGVTALERMGIDPVALSHTRVRTPSGGYHLYFDYAPGITNSANHLPHGVDVRGDGGYVIAPGAVTQAGEYRYVTRSRIDRDLIGRSEFPTALRQQDKNGSDRISYQPAHDNDLDLSVVQVRSLLEALSAGAVWLDRRDGWLRVGMALHHHFAGADDGFELWCEFSEKSEHYNLQELRQQWRSLSGRNPSNPVTMASLVSDAGPDWYWENVRWHEIPGDFADEDIPADESRFRSHLQFLRPSEIEQIESRRQLVKGLVAEGDVGCIVGAPGVGKSFLAPRLSYAIAQGKDVFGLRVRQGNVLYVAAEDQFGMGQRIRALRQTHGDTDALQLVTGVSDLLSKDSRDLKALRVAVKDQRPAVIFIDTLAMAFPGLEENSAEGMGRVVAVARSLTKWGAAVILIHHDTKDGQQGLPRGHSLLNGALDFSLSLKRGDNGIVRGKLSKNRNGSCDLDIAFRIETEILGVDEDGDEVTAALAEPLEGFSYPTRPKLTPQETVAFAALECVAGDQCSIDLEKWRGAFFENGDQPYESRRKAWKRVRDALTEKGFIEIDGETVTLLALRSRLKADEFQDE